MAKIKIIGGFSENKRKDGTYQTGYAVYDKEGVCPTLLADGGGYGIMIIEEEKIKLQRAEMNNIDKTRQDNGYACSHECQVVVLGNMDNTIDHTFESANRVYDKNNLCPTILTCAGGGIQPKIIEASSSENINYVETVYRIRKLTPKECFRLMSFRDEDYEAASKVNSNTQLYKQAGNSICECVLKAIFSQMGIKGVPKWNDTH